VSGRQADYVTYVEAQLAWLRRMAYADLTSTRPTRKGDLYAAMHLTYAVAGRADSAGKLFKLTIDIPTRHAMRPRGTLACCCLSG
jgi:hypothetical protein